MKHPIKVLSTLSQCERVNAKESVCIIIQSRYKRVAHECDILNVAKYRAIFFKLGNDTIIIQSRCNTIASNKFNKLCVPKYSSIFFKLGNDIY